MKFPLLRFTYLLLTLAAIGLGCNQDPGKVDLFVIDRYLTNTPVFDLKYLDSLSKVYPQSDYIIGMNALGLIHNDNITTAEKLMSGLNDPSTYSFMAKGVLHEKMKDTAMAKFYFNKAIETDIKQHNKWLRLYLFYHFKNKNLSFALDNLRKSIEIDSLFNQAIIEGAYQLSPTNQCDSIIELLTKINENYRDESYVSFLGDAYYSCNNMSKASLAYIKSNEIKENGFACFGLGAIEHYENLNYSEAERYYKKASGFEETQCIARIGLGWLNFDYRSFKNAETFMKEALNECETQENYNEIISFLIKMKNYTEAKKVVLRSEEKYSVNYFTEGFKMMIDILKNDLPDSEENNMIHDYYLRYGDAAVEWLNSMIKDDNSLNKIKVNTDTYTKII